MPAIDIEPAGFPDRPWSHIKVATLSDTVDLPYVTRAFHVAVAGDVKLTSQGGETETVPLTAGWHPGRVTRFWATGTTATGISYVW